MNNYHTSVLLDEAVESLQIREKAWYVDGTLGGGGHTIAIARKAGNVIGLDVDEDAIAFVAEKKKELAPDVAARMTLVRSNFIKLREILSEKGIDAVSGILLDLGVSSHQLDTSSKGFSIRSSGPLDMRMNKELTVTAKDLVNGLTKRELVELFKTYGEERFAFKIAGEIERRRERKAIETTADLAQLIEEVVGRKPGGIHPATRVFQALRIAVNDELNILKEAIETSLDVLKPGGRLAIIAFHSLEDRIVKRAFLAIQREGRGIVITKKPMRPTASEREANPRSESAKLRVLEKSI